MGERLAPASAPGADTLTLMRRPGRSLAWLLAVSTACGQVEPVLLPVTMPDCLYQGTSAMEAGTARLSLAANSLGRFGVALVEVESETTAADVEEHLTAVEETWGQLPEGANTRLLLRLDESMGVDGVEETVPLRPGSYALICIVFPYGEGEPGARLAGMLTVGDG